MNNIWDVKLWVLNQKLREENLYKEWSQINKTFMEEWKIAIEKYQKDKQYYYNEKKKNKNNTVRKPNNQAKKYYVLNHSVL